MAKPSPKQNTIDTSNLLPSIFIIGFLCVGFIPNWEAVDKIAPQWLYLSLLNLFSGLYLFLNRKLFKERIAIVLSSWMSIFYIAFVIWAAFSYLYAINPTEVLVNIVRHFNTLFMFLNLGIFVYSIKDKNRLLSMVIMGILAIEVYSVLEQALEMYKAGAINPGELKGVTANRNITAFSIAIKIPYVLYLIYTSKKMWIRLTYSFLVLFSLFSLSMIESRASYIAAILIGVVILFWTLLGYFKNKSLKEFVHNLYYVIPLLLALLLNQFLFSGKGADALSRASTISISQADSSINKRLRYYEDVATHFVSNPILGVGIGNWKLSSVHYDREDIDGYIVPYHAHSDFIQLGAELGIIGFLLYLGVFIIAGFYAFRLLFKSNLEAEKKWFILLLITALGVYFIDANLNFPIARPQVLAPWALTMALISYYHNQTKDQRQNDGSKKISFLFPVIVILIMLLSTKISYTTYQSLKGQMFLLRDFNSNKFSVTIDKIDNITPDIPNITVTTIPMKSIKARYYFNANKYDKALKLLNEGIPANPYLFFSENLKAQIFLKLNKIDSAFVNARKAFYGLPKNALHASTYAQTLSVKRDVNEAKKVFEVLSKKSGPTIWKNFLIVLSQMVQGGEKDLVKYASQASKFYPNDKELFSIKKLAVVGQANINRAAVISENALSFFNKGLYVEAAIEFERASELDPLEYAHFENAASAYFMGGDYGKSLIYSEKVMNDFEIKTGKSEYICALTNFNIGGKERACDLLLRSINFGYDQAQATYDNRCN